MTKRSYAKINLILKILDRRKDGYHTLFSLFQRIDLWDELSFEPEGDRIVLESACALLPLDRTNLIFQAVELLCNKSNKNRGLRVKIQKNIPMGAGLGGGSSNAATTLLEMNKEWKLGYTTEDLAKMGESLGSDIPFFCHQVSTAWVRGRGEKVQPASFSPNLWILLIFPGFAIGTREAYSLWDQAHSEQKNKLTINGNNNTISSFQTLNDRSYWNHLENDFESVLFDRFPVFKVIKECLFEQGADKVLMSGSGSTLYGVYQSEKKAKAAEESLKKAFPDHFVQLVRTI
ncbi:MAG: 4-(cytidine 5'-diphospho)-2-C-methyl-D-erythritol kinase [Nitrospirae bacterium]|nr:4-(cytidine 5'-diphospho)-2-C-methyl-D-erythritol kinase [Nitrospirota bacterium]MBI3594441.1 4-(cytidine 5'-diphospho)-2-C-methyl-D-erythritol kinase [Nitrospirota bacterium]